MVDWKSIRDKYENNCETFVSNLLEQTGSKEYAHSGDFFYQRKDCSKNQTDSRKISKSFGCRAAKWRNLVFVAMN